METQNADGEVYWRHGHSTNLVGLPTGLLASTAFNDSAPELHIAGVREANPSLFCDLDSAVDRNEAAARFEAYMVERFKLEPRRSAAQDGGGPRRYRASYHRLLRGWAFDSNGAEAAVLKGWVESRFGLFPTFHKEPLRRFSSPAWSHYIEQKMGSRFHNNAIFAQLDLMYEYAQWWLRRFHPGRRHFVLYRGVSDYAEHHVVERVNRRQVVLRLNNLVSFTAERDVAGWFGDFILEAEVPVTKVLFCNDLLPRHALKGEGEVLVIGGDFRASASYL